MSWKQLSKEISCLDMWLPFTSLLFNFVFNKLIISWIFDKEEVFVNPLFTAEPPFEMAGLSAAMDRRNKEFGKEFFRCVDKNNRHWVTIVLV